MLAKEQRLPRSSFKELLERGRTLSSAHFSFKYKKLALGEKSIFSAVISKKVLKTAVARHMLKRRLYVLLRRETVSRSPIAGVLFARSGAGDLSFKELTGELQKLLSAI